MRATTGVERTWQVREADERYSQLVELAPDAILIHDGERIVLANAAAVRLAGAANRTELLGRPIDAFLEPPHLKSVQAQLTDTDSPAELAPPVRDTFRRVDGVEVEVEVRAIAFLDHGHPAAHLVIRDITERLAAERAQRLLDDRIQQAQKMETVGALAGGVAHEVNNMMSVILGFGTFLLEDEVSAAERAADARQIMKAAERAAAVTQQLLTFSRGVVHRPKAIDLGDALRGTEPVLRRLFGADRSLVLASTAAPRVRVDPGQLEQVIFNLAINARDATPPGGTLAVTTAEVELPTAIPAADGAPIPPGRYGTLCVEDSGCGMNSAIRARIFEPFFSTKAVGEGTGLGLAAVHGILLQNDGHITVSSAPGAGSTFTVYLPVIPEPESIKRPGAPPAADAPARHDGISALIVDDEPGVRAIASRILALNGFVVTVARDGINALELVDAQGPPQLVLTDVMMPGIGGIELADRLRERWPELPIVFMSGYSAEVLADEGSMGVGAELIQKPFTPAGLVQRVSDVLRRTGAAITPSG